MLTKMIIAVFALIILAFMVKGFQSANGYLSDIQIAAQQRAAVYANR